jgi:hypothetical protein
MRSSAANGMGIIISINANRAKQVKHLAKKVILFFGVSFGLWLVKRMICRDYFEILHIVLHYAKEVTVLRYVCPGVKNNTFYSF